MEKELTTKIYDDNLLLFSDMIKDIGEAKEYVCLETYRFAEDAIGKRFREALVKKAKEGIKIDLLLDAYGTKYNDHFFCDLVSSGAEVRFFKKIKWFPSNAFAKNHTRNHRKLLLIDDYISYIGSSNLAAYSISWRELNLRIEGGLCTAFKQSFEASKEKYKFYEVLPYGKSEVLHWKNYSILQDIPSASHQNIRNQFLNMINTAKKEVSIITPYFITSNKVRKVLIRAAERNIKIKIYIPHHSDIGVLDILRNRYLGPLHQAGIEWRFYTNDNLHAKCITADGNRYMLGSSNFDYRSFRYQYEIMLYGKDKNTCQLIENYIQKTDTDCIAFDYEKWKNVPRKYRLVEYLLSPFKRLF